MIEERICPISLRHHPQWFLAREHHFNQIKDVSSLIHQIQLAVHDDLLHLAKSAILDQISKPDHLLAVSALVRNYKACSRIVCRRHHLLTEAGLRHEKDLDSNLVEPAIYRFLYLIKKHKFVLVKT